MDIKKLRKGVKVVGDKMPFDTIKNGLDTPITAPMEIPDSYDSRKVTPYQKRIISLVVQDILEPYMISPKGIRMYAHHFYDSEKLSATPTILLESGSVGFVPIPIPIPFVTPNSYTRGIVVMPQHLE